MPNVVATSMAKGSCKDVVEALQKDLSAQLNGARPVFTLLFASTKQPLTVLMPLFKETWHGLLLGSSTAGEFTEAGDQKGAVSAIAVAGDFAAYAGMGRDLKANPEAAVKTALANQPTSYPGLAHRTALMLVDPLAGNSERVVELTSALLGPRTVLAGGAAGDDLGMARTFVGVDREVASDAVVLVSLFSTKPLAVGVHHGHHPLSKPMEVTRSSGNVVQQIDGKPAWTAWKEVTREHALRAGVNLDTASPEAIGAHLLRYEAGVSVGVEQRIRAPLSVNPDGSINFACGIPSGTKIRITESSSQRQLSSARAAARLARPASMKKAAGAIVFDCICRNLILGKEFGAAVRGISEELGGVKLAGFETYGEIALDAGDFSGFHNTTTVVLSIPA